MDNKTLNDNLHQINNFSPVALLSPSNQHRWKAALTKEVQLELDVIVAGIKISTKTPLYIESNIRQFVFALVTRLCNFQQVPYGFSRTC